MVEVLYPFLAMVFFSLLQLPLMLGSRVWAIRKKNFSIKHFRLNELEMAPEFMKKVTRHYSNLFEMPVIFYALCLAGYVTMLEASLFIKISWIYVAFRIIHWAIHITYNNVYHRLIPFAASNLCLLAMAILLTKSLV